MAGLILCRPRPSNRRSEFPIHGRIPGVHSEVAGSGHASPRGDVVAPTGEDGVGDVVPSASRLDGPGTQSWCPMGDRGRGGDAADDRRGHANLPSRGRVLRSSGRAPFRLIQGGVSSDRFLRRSQPISTEGMSHPRSPGKGAFDAVPLSTRRRDQIY